MLFRSMVFGGNTTVDEHGRNITESNSGMLGIYIGKFPDKTSSTNGWARWSGTSFAAATMSGMFARAARRGCDISRDAAVNFYDELVKQKDGNTVEGGEPFIKSRQKV